MGNLVTNRVRIEAEGDPTETLRRFAALVSSADPDDVAAEVANTGRSVVPFEPLRIKPMPEQLLAIPAELPEKIDLAIAASSKFDLVSARERLRDPEAMTLPFMRPPNRVQVIERERHATKTLDELHAWARENIPDAVRAADLMKIALRDTGHMEPHTWFRDEIGARAVAEDACFEVSGNTVIIGFDTVNAAPNGWFGALAEKAPNDVFMTWSWDEDTDYSVAGLADGDGEIMIEESHDEDDLRRVIAGGRGLVGRAAISRDEEDYDPS